MSSPAQAFTIRPCPLAHPLETTSLPNTYTPHPSLRPDQPHFPSPEARTPPPLLPLLPPTSLSPPAWIPTPQGYIWKRDFPHIKYMGSNLVRVDFWDTSRDHTLFLGTPTSSHRNPAL